MRAYQVFAAMSPDRAVEVLRTLAEQSPAMFSQALVAAAGALNLRPVYVQRQPFENRAKTVRRAMARVGANAVAEEILATYFLECRSELLVEWLDSIGLEHEEGTLKDEAPGQPTQQQLERAVRKFRDGSPDRELLLRAFASQSAVEWPALDALLGSQP